MPSRRSHHRGRASSSKAMNIIDASQGALSAHFYHSRRQLLAILLPLLVLVVLVGYTAYRGFPFFPIRDQSIENQITEVRKNMYGVYTYEIVNEFNHDPTAFTQGLVYAGNDTLYESTGMYGSSSVRRVHIISGEVLQLHQMEKEYFGEGLTLLNHRLFQVAWRVTFGFIYDESTLSLLDSFKHPMQDGWGLATDGKVLYGSDGTSTIYVMHPSTFAEERSFTVKDRGKEITRLNELEYIDGELWANVWMKNCIVRISPNDGQVLGWILLHNLRRDLLARGNKLDVLNGIAWDQDKNRIYVTGKYWPKLYEIKVHPHSENLKDHKDVWKRCNV